MILEISAGIRVAVLVLHLLRLLPVLLLIVAAMVFSPSASAAGVDSRAYTCNGLHSLVAANRFVYINYPSFMDFVVASSSFCSAGEMLGLRSVPTSDTPECLVNYCRKRPSATN